MENKQQKATDGARRTEPSREIRSALFELIRFGAQTKSGVNVLFDTFDAARDTEGFVSSYRTVFAAPPWSEKISDTEARRQLSSLLSQRWPYFRVVRPQEECALISKVIGFCVGSDLPEEYVPLIGPHTRASHAPVSDRVFYEAEIGISDEAKGNGFANVLMAERVRYAIDAGYDYVASRTLDSNAPITRIYGRFGYLRVCTDPKHQDRGWWLLDLRSGGTALELELAKALDVTPVVRG